jgi:hypothetical protein
MLIAAQALKTIEYVAPVIPEPEPIVPEPEV